MPSATLDKAIEIEAGESSLALLSLAVRTIGSEAGVTGCGAGVLDALGALQALDAAIDRRIRDEDASDDVPPALAA